jgi:hypothetical protein
MNQIRVIIDASPLLLRSAGVKTYVHHWTRSLAETRGQNRVTLFPYLDGAREFTHEKSVLGPAGTLARLALLHGASRTPPPALEWLTAGGDIFHGQLSPDQLFSLRPVLGYARYRGPLAGLYHCGSGAHPGGGVSAAPGYNAASQIIADLAR